MSVEHPAPVPAARLTPPRPAVPSPEEYPAAPVTPERRSSMTPLALLVVLIVGYVLIQVQFVLVLVLLSLVFATVIQQFQMEIAER